MYDFDDILGFIAKTLGVICLLAFTVLVVWSICYFILYSLSAV